MSISRLIPYRCQNLLSAPLQAEKLLSWSTNNGRTIARELAFLSNHSAAMFCQSPRPFCFCVCLQRSRKRQHETTEETTEDELTKRARMILHSWQSETPADFDRSVGLCRSLQARRQTRIIALKKTSARNVV